MSTTRIPSIYVSTRTQPRGFTLLIAIIMTSVVLAVALALLDVSYKQVILASASRKSEYAFYAADSALECAIYMDSKSVFDYTSEPTSGSFSCEGVTVNYTAPTQVLAPRTTTFSIPCPGDGTAGDAQADVTIFKQSNGSTNLYANGYNTCIATDPNRIQRGLEAKY